MTSIAIASDGLLHPLREGLGKPSPIRFHYLYSVDKPYSVSLQFEVAEDVTVTWEFARDLLMEALANYQVVGDGDVQISHACIGGDDDLIYFHLTSPDGEARISASDVPARTWATRSYLMVGKGMESMSDQVDAAIAQILLEQAS